MIGTTTPRRLRRRGFSLVEMLIALAISATSSSESRPHNPSVAKMSTDGTSDGGGSFTTLSWGSADTYGCSSKSPRARETARIPCTRLREIKPPATQS